MMSKRTTFIKALKAELAIWQKDWQKVWGKTEEFTDQSKQKRYDRINYLIAILECATDREIEDFSARIERRKQAEESQQSLF